MASISQIKLPNNSVYDIKAKYDINGNVISDTYLRKDFDSIGHNVSFNSSVDIDDLTVGTLLVTGAARFTNGLIGNLKGTASNVPWSGVTSKPSTYPPSAHTHTIFNISNWETYVYNAQGFRIKNTVLAAPNGADGKAAFRNLVPADIPSLDASKITSGVFDIARLPQGALERLTIVADDTARFKLTSSNIQNGDTVKVTATGKMYYVVDETKLSSEAGYEVYAAGTAASVPWSGVTSKPSTYPPSAHTHTIFNISNWETYVYNAQGFRTKNTVLAAPNGADGKAAFRTLVEADIPALSKSKVGLSNVDNTADSTKNVLSASKLTTARNITIGSAKKSFDGASDILFSLSDIGASSSSHTHNYASKVTLAGTDYSCVSNAITITKANLQTAIGSTGLGLMTEKERSKLDSIKVSSGGTIDFSGVTASGVLTATIGKDKTVALTHNTSGVKAGTYKSVTVDTYGHVTAGTNPTTLSGYGITDALSSSTKYALSDSVGGNALRAISDKNGKDIDSTYLKMFTSRGLRTCTGDGKYNYFKIATIKISTPYINRPIVFELSGRGRSLSLITVIYGNSNTTDPSVGSFTTNGDTSYWIKKVDTSTWEVYGAYSEVWGSCCLHRVTGEGADIGITINMTNINALPSDCIQATPGGSVGYATQAVQDGAGNVITSKYVTIDTTQTISGAKTFSKETTISSATASTSKTTGALKVKGGIASEGQISADKAMIGDAVTLEYNAELQCLNFVFA